MSDLNFKEVPAEYKAHVAPKKTRTDEQITIDGVVAKVLEEYFSEGCTSKTKFVDLPSRFVAVASEDLAETFRYMIRKGGNLHSARIRFGQPVTDANGHIVVSFAAVPNKSHPRYDGGDE
jgi:hypothetical protein